MKQTTLAIVLLSLCTWKSLHAQEKMDTSLKLQDIQLTNAPAFSLMDVSPSSIQSPASTKAFAASIANTLTQGTGLPQNYALEFTPFWFTPHQRFSNHKYFGVTADGKSIPTSQIRFISLSFALINKDSATNVGKLANHNASLGVRATLIKIYSGATRKKISQTAVAWDTALAGRIGELNGEAPTQAQVD